MSLCDTVFITIVCVCVCVSVSVIEPGFNINLICSSDLQTSQCRKPVAVHLQGVCVAASMYVCRGGTTAKCVHDVGCV